jgi:tetratricopeptide (TPR) repeat protein
VPSLEVEQTKRPLLAILVSVFAVAAVVAGVLWYAHWQAIKSDNQEFANLQAVARNASGGQGSDDLAVLWTHYAARTPSKIHRNAAYLYAAAIYVTNSEYSQAAKMCELAEKSGGVTFQEAEVAATAYYNLGDKAKAIHYYKLAASLVPANLSDRQGEIDSFNKTITSLQQ